MDAHQARAGVKLVREMASKHRAHIRCMSNDDKVVVQRLLEQLFIYFVQAKIVVGLPVQHRLSSLGLYPQGASPIFPDHDKRGRAH